jgi:hypothetical protein
MSMGTSMYTDRQTDTYEHTHRQIDNTRADRHMQIDTNKHTS